MTRFELIAYIARAIAEAKSKTEVEDSLEYYVRQFSQYGEEHGEDK